MKSTQQLTEAHEEVIHQIKGLFTAVCSWSEGKMAVRKDLYVWTVNSCYSWKLNINRIELKTKESHAC